MLDLSKLISVTSIFVDWIFIFADILINTTLTYYGFQTRISDYLSNLPLKLSLNKNGLRADSVTGIITAIKDCNVPEVISSAVSTAEDDNYRTDYEEPVNMWGVKICGRSYLHKSLRIYKK